MRVETLQDSSLVYKENQHTLLRVGMKVVAYMAAIGFAVLSLIRVNNVEPNQPLPEFSTLAGYSLLSFATFRYLS